jgi:hypothetical protein
LYDYRPFDFVAVVTSGNPLEIDPQDCDILCNYTVGLEQAFGEVVYVSRLLSTNASP